MSLEKSYRADVEFEGEFSHEPLPQSIHNIKLSADKAIGSILHNSGWRVGTPTVTQTGLSDRAWKLIIPFRRLGKRRFETEDAANQAKEIVGRLMTGHASRNMVGWKPVGSFAGIGEPEREENYRAPEDMLIIPPNYIEFFDGIYERETQIKRMMKAIQVAHDSRMEVRDHVLLYGEPACGKTSLCISIMEMLAPLGGVERFDATDTTKVGAVQSLMDRVPAPAIVIIEELEKVEEKQIPYLLAMMDARGELRRVTARTDRTKQVKALVIATVNDLPKLKSVYSGAVYSRFGNKIYCPLPSEKLVKKVLMTQVLQIPGGNPAWVAPAIAYAEEEGSMRDIRRIKSILVSGGDDLLTGEYQREQRELRMAEENDQELLTSLHGQSLRDGRVG